MSDQDKGLNSLLAEESKDLLDAYVDLRAAIERSGYDVSPCMICQELVVCIPDGLPICRYCAEKAGG